MNNIEWRNYQLDCIETIKKHFQTSNKQLIQLPTGSGKTYIFLKYIKENCKKTLIICPTKELVEQVEDSAKRFGLENDLFAKNGSSFKNKDHIVLTAASLNFENTQNFLKKQVFDTIIIDEAHKSQCTTYIKFLEEYSKINPNFNLIGMTATPERMDKKPLLDIFGELTFDLSIYDLIQEGHLCDIISYRVTTERKLRVKNDQSDFSLKELNKLDCESRNRLIFKTYKENCVGKKTIVFCVSIEHSLNLSNFFKSQSVRAESVNGNMPFNQRKQILERFRNGNLDVIFNCQLLTEGFDAPCIESIIIARPTRSKSLYTQMVGRGLRNFPGKDFCYLYELTDNAHKICDFNVCAGKENDFTYDYKPGTKLTDLFKEINEISLKEYELKKTKINILQDFEGYLDSMKAIPSQLEKLNFVKKDFIESLTFKEASFLLWKQRLKNKYG